jgi:hypothetical protein
MKTAYLAVPYSHKNKSTRMARFDCANIAAAHLFKLGYNVLSPISHSHPISQYMDNSNDSAFWVSVDEYWQRHCDVLFVLKIEGWKDSAGVHREIGLAIELGQTIKFLEGGDIGI